MKITVWVSLCLSLCVHGLCTVEQPRQIHAVFHHKDVLMLPPSAMELVVLYASASLPKIGAVDEQDGGTMQKRTYTIESVVVDSAVMKRFPLSSDQGYTMCAQQVGKSLELIITYDRARSAVGVSTFNTIGSQVGLAFHICPSKPGVQKKKERQKLIVVDCGHGGKDTGAVSALGVQEKEVTLAVGRKLKTLLQAQGITVIMTRTADCDLLLDARTLLANAYDADLFVSLHANYAQNKSASGIETWYLLPKITILSDCSDSAAIGYIAEVIKHRSAHGHIPSQYIHQQLVLGAKKQCAQVGDRHIKSAISQVLLGCRMPAVLVELGFLSNSIEAQRLINVEYQDMQARSICAGIVDYFTYLDKLGK